METNKVVIVTGGTRGIGKALSLGMIKHGYKVAALYRGNEEASQQLKKEAAGLGGILKTYKMSVDDYQQVSDCFKKVRAELGDTGVLINNAGITRDGYLMIMKEEDWKDVINTNLLGVLNCIHAVLPEMKKQKSGVIINISSIAGYIGISGQTNYSATKCALIGLTSALSSEVIKDNIYVYALAPGYVNTEMLSTIPPGMLTKFINAIPMKRAGEPEEICRTALTLIEKRFSYSTGQTFLLDGGQSFV